MVFPYLIPPGPITRMLARFPGLLAAALALVVLMAACGDDEEPTTMVLLGPADLQGKTIGVASLGDALTLETRYVLQEAYGLDARIEGGDVTIVESPAEELPTQLRDGGIDGAVMVGLGAFRLLGDEEFRVLSQVTDEMQALTGAPIMNSILVTYADVAEQKNGALSEVNRLLAESLTYFRANQDEVLDAVAEGEGVDREFLQWWWERQDLLLGDRSVEAQEQILSLWQVAAAIGDVEYTPDMVDVLFMGAEEESAAAMEGDRTTVSLALLDNPNRRAALYAIEQGIVTSESVDLDVNYLLPSAISEAAPARQYDVVETTPLAVPQGVALDLDFVILSAGLQNLDGTLLFVKGEPASR
jgi:hypothetical protein